MSNLFQQLKRFYKSNAVPIILLTLVTFLGSVSVLTSALPAKCTGTIDMCNRPDKDPILEFTLQNLGFMGIGSIALVLAVSLFSFITENSKVQNSDNAKI